MQHFVGWSYLNFHNYTTCSTSMERQLNSKTWHDLALRASMNIARARVSASKLLHGNNDGNRKED